MQQQQEEAKSLKCNDCNLLLRSVKEAQDHADATGHSNFAETTVAIKTLVCTDCGKPCRTAAEQHLHTRHTGHTSFVEKSHSATLNTEAEMAEARAQDDNNDNKDNESTALFPAEVNPDLLAQLIEMGFSENRATRAIYHSGGEAADAAVAWLAEHEDEPDLDEPLLVAKHAVKRKISVEEAKELMRKAKEKREADERESERLRELERIKMGKELAAIARKEEEARLRRQAEERQREKEEEERAREAIRKKLEQDRRERRARLGLPEELNEEEKEEERRREREKAEREARRRLPVKPVVKAERMRQILVEMKKTYEASDPNGLKTAWSTLLKIISNIGMHPQEAKYRRVRLSNAAIQQRVVKYTGSVEFLQLCGFVECKRDDEDVLEMEEADRLVLETAAENLNSALTNPFFGAL